MVFYSDCRSIKPRAEAIYGTRGGPFANGGWGGATHRGDKVYIFAKPWKEESFTLGPLTQKVKSAKTLVEEHEVEFSQTEDGLTFSLSRENRDPSYTVIVLTLDAPVADGTIVKVKTN
ncbi:MAG: hypothetical protein O3C57_07350 [Verrucomicrobia bacterium]|nr:hypothetical protein [Verrucomicrobiota bacterium]